MNKKNYHFILGASDPEMEAIESLLKEHGCSFDYATTGCVRVHPGNAYGLLEFEVLFKDPRLAQAQAVVVENNTPMRGWSNREVIVVDHHRPGDPGYGKGPDQYWEASSIGQVCALLGIEPDHHLRLVAAADHCLGAAYRGQCPGVDPDDLMEWRTASRAAFQKRSVDAVLADVAAAREILKSHQIGGLADLTEHDHIPELPEAAVREGICFISKIKDRDGRSKIVCQVGSPDQIQYFLEHYAPESGLIDTYGDPARGFAGGYLKD